MRKDRPRGRQKAPFSNLTLNLLIGSCHSRRRNFHMGANITNLMCESEFADRILRLLASVFRTDSVLLHLHDGDKVRLSLTACPL